MECLHIPEIAYGEFASRLIRRADDQRFPVGCSIEITERCNLRCAHCYINRPAADREAQTRELSFPQWARLLEAMAAEGCLWLLLTGGEPLLRPDFQDIYLHAKKLGIIVTLFTNATLITPALADLLQEFPPFNVEITVYGRTRATYEAVTRVSGSYDKCLRGIELLLDRQVPLELKTMVMTTNIDELWDLKAWAKGLGVRFRYDPVLNPRLDGGRGPLALRLSPEAAVEFDIRDEGRAKVWQKAVANLEKQSEEYLYTCGAGISSAHINAYGEMQICMMARSACFDLAAGSFKEGWQEFLPRLRRQRPRGDYPCSNCELGSLCVQCPAWAELEQGEPDSRVDYLCRLTHLRAEAFGVDAAKIKEAKDGIKEKV